MINKSFIEPDDSERPLPIAGRIKNVLLMSLPSVIASGDRDPHDENIMHLGIGYLAAVMRENGYRVKVLDCYAENMFNQRSSVDNGWIELGLSDEQIISLIGDFNPDLIGMTIPFSCQHFLALRLAKQIKAAFPHVTLVAGGNHVTAIPERIDPSLFDFLILGEGEYTLLNLIESLNNGRRPNELSGVYSSKNGHAKFINNLDELPFPALDLLPLSKFWSSGRRWINMVATRGCVYNCSFCSIHTVMGHKIRRRSIDNVIAEIKHWKSMYGIQEVYFEDDNLTADAHWAKELFRRIAENRFGVRFHLRNGIRADSIDREMLVLMKSAGFYDFMISPESGSQETLDKIIGKKMRLTDCENAVKLAREVGLGVNAFFVVGFPQETWEHLQRTLDYAKYLKSQGVVGFWLSSACPLPGTRLYQECIQKGLIDPDNIDFRRLRTPDYVINHPIFTAAELKAFRAKGMKELAPSQPSLRSTITKGLNVLIRDPSFFLMKLRYKLSLRIQWV